MPRLQAKRHCQYPGCNTPIPRSKYHESRIYCQTHKGFKKGGWTHQTSCGVMSLSMLKQLGVKA